MSVSSQPNSADSSNAAKPTRPDLAHSTGVADSGRWSTRRIAMYALFVALAMATSFISFPILPNPAFSFLKYDPSGIVCLIAGFAYGPAAAAIVSVLGFVPHVFMDPWGTLMAVLVALALSVPAALIYRHAHTRKGAVIGLVVGACWPWSRPSPAIWSSRRSTPAGRSPRWRPSSFPHCCRST